MSIFKNLKWLVPATLLLVILMRLVGMQLRTFEVQADYRALVTQASLVNRLDSSCALDADRYDSQVLADFIEAKAAAGLTAYHWYISPGYLLWLRGACDRGVFKPSFLVSANQWLFVAVVAISSLMVRMLAGSWVLALIAAATLLSRGHLVAQMGDTGPNIALMFLVTLWITSIVHFFRSGSFLSFVGGLVLLGVTCLFELSFWLQGLVLPLILCIGFVLRRHLARPVLERFRSEKKRIKRMLQQGTDTFQQGSLISGILLDLLQRILKPRGDDLGQELGARHKKLSQSLLFAGLKEPFPLWAFRRRRWLTMVLSSSLVALSYGLAVYLFLLYSDTWMYRESVPSVLTDLWELWFATWVQEIIYPFDVHLLISGILIVLCCMQSPAAGIRGVFEISWFLLVGMAVAVLGTAGFDILDMIVIQNIENSFGAWTIMAWGRASKVLLWFEPVILTLGVVGAYQLLVISRRSLMYAPGTRF